MESKYFEDYEVGETFSTAGRTITDADQLNYAGLSGNYNAIHLDEELMEDSRYGGRLAYGYLLLTVMEGQKVQLGIMDDSVIAFYGVDTVRFPTPVMIGETIHTELTVIELEDRDDDSGILVLEEKGLTQDDDVAVVAETRTLVEKRE